MGASTRAAAYSAIRARLTPICGDLFADFDLRQSAHVQQIADYPGEFIEFVREFPGLPWIYTGGLENEPDLVGQIAKTNPLWGNDSSVLEQIRNPWQVAAALSSTALPVLKVAPPQTSNILTEHPWIQKPLRGAAGKGIKMWGGDSTGSGEIDSNYYLQEFKLGVPHSALYLAYAGNAWLIGVTRQLVGETEVGAPPFAWCGTIAPISVAEQTRELMESIGACLARNFQLVGLFGCDFLMENDIPWLTEVNPRYPASTEILESELKIPLLAWHYAACDSSSRDFSYRQLVQQVKSANHSAAQVAGKIVRYATQDSIAPDWRSFASPPSDHSLPFMADIPIPGSPLPKGLPVCTLFARAATVDECRRKLIRRACRVYR